MIRKSFVLTTLASALLCAPVLADVTGKVTFDGKAPARKKINMAAVPQCAAIHKEPLLEESFIVNSQNKGLANVVVSITNPPDKGKVPDQPAVFDQKGCQYVPHVLPLMVGQKILVKNSDPFLHNVHGLPETNPGFNFGQNNIDPGKPVSPMKAVEEFRVKCDVHPWMGAFFVVLDHPYFGTTDQDGAFTIKGLKDGVYEIRAWHERLGEQEGKVTVKDGKGELNIIFKPEEEEANATPVTPIKAVSLESLTAEGKSCCSAQPAAVVQK